MWLYPELFSIDFKILPFFITFYFERMKVFGKSCFLSDQAYEGFWSICLIWSTVLILTPVAALWNWFWVFFNCSEDLVLIWDDFLGSFFVPIYWNSPREEE